MENVFADCHSNYYKMLRPNLQCLRKHAGSVEDIVSFWDLFISNRSEDHLQSVCWPITSFQTRRSGASSEPVPTLKPVICVSPAEELALAQVTGSRVALTLFWFRINNHSRQGLRKGLTWPRTNWNHLSPFKKNRACVACSDLSMGESIKCFDYFHLSKQQWSEDLSCSDVNVGTQSQEQHL